METALLSVELRHEHDVVLARQRAGQIAELLGFDAQDQTRIATAVSEIARNAFEYAHGGRATYAWDDAPPALVVRVSDAGPGIANAEAVLSGTFTSRTGLGVGLVGAKRIMDALEVTSEPGQGTCVLLRKNASRRVTHALPNLNRVLNELSRFAPSSPFQEVQKQNQELVRALDELRAREAELAQLNRELSDTNRGVMALHNELDEKVRQLEQANGQKTRFLSHMSHEFRTPLNSILGLARLLLDHIDGPLLPEQEKQIQFIHRSAALLAEAVSDLLDTAKIESGTIEVWPQEFSVEDLFSSLRGVFRPLFGQSPVALVFEDASLLPLLCSDEAKVAQILRNFLSNALKFTEQGTIRVGATLVPPDRVTLWVEDPGIGIAPEDTERIFEEFAQVSGAFQRRVRGTGLGLPLSRRLAELLGGQVSVTSQTGVGSTFSLTLPLCYPSSAPAP